VHNLAVDSKGNIYTAEVDTGKRIQKFVPRDDKDDRDKDDRQ
jgi:sugar lactone lactonase YvrE